MRAVSAMPGSRSWMTAAPRCSRCRWMWSVLGTDAATLADLDGHRAADHVARGQILGVGRVALHEALALGVGEVAALAARAFGDQAARAVDAGRMELHELHVLQRQARRAAPWRCHRRCRSAPRCRRSRRGHSRRWRGSSCARGSDAACLRSGRAPRTPRHSPSSMIRSIAKYSTKNVAEWRIDCW